MSDSSVEFEARMRQRLLAEQRRAVLEALRDDIEAERTVGEVYDAAHALGWSGPLADLSLADLAAVLVTDEDDADDDEAANEGESEVAVEPVVAAPVPRAKKATKKAATKKTAKKAATDQAATKKAAARATAKKAAKTATKKSAKKAAAKTTAKKTGRRRKKIVIAERMSLEEAVDVFVPLIEGLGEATMQDLEDATEAGRRKLRFHVGQLVKHGYLERHGMGRGTYYTVA